MAEVNGVGANQELRYVQQGENLPVASGGGQCQPNSVNAQNVNTQGVGTTVQTGTNFNQYGNDIENFEKFKGNDKHDAMRMTATAANDVKKAYMQLQHEFPDVAIAFDPMPDPKTCGKKREGFFNYQLLLEQWKGEALQKIADARETTTRQMGNEIIANSNKNAAFNAEVTVATGEAVMANDDMNTAILAKQVDGVEDAVHTEGKKTRGAVHAEGAATRNAVYQEGKMTRDVVHMEGAATRNTVRKEGVYTRNVVRDEADMTRDEVRYENAKTRDTVELTAKQTQELDGISQKITTNFSSGQVHTQNTIDRVNNMRNQILQSNIPYEQKKELLTHLAAFSTQTVINFKELKDEEVKIKNAINRY